MRIFAVSGKCALIFQQWIKAPDLCIQSLFRFLILFCFTPTGSSVPPCLRHPQRPCWLPGSGGRLPCGRWALPWEQYADLDLIAFDFQNGDLDIVVDDDCFVLLTGQCQHLTHPPFRISGCRIPDILPGIYLPQG